MSGLCQECTCAAHPKHQRFDIGHEHHQEDALPQELYPRARDGTLVSTAGPCRLSEVSGSLDVEAVKGV